MKTNNTLKSIFGIMFLFLMVVPFVSAGQTWFYFESDTSASSMTLTQGQSTNLLLTASSHNNIPVSYEKVEAIQGSNKYLLQSWNEAGVKKDSVYTFNKIYNLNSGVLNPGTYTLRFSATTNTGVEYSELTLIVESPTTPDTQAPIITRLGISPVYHEVRTNYVDAGATAWDNIDGDLTSEIVMTGSVNSNILGTYTLRYNVADNAGNSAQEVTRTVIVRDTQAPVITLNGANPITIALGGTYTEQGATVTDNYYTGLTATINGNVNTNAVGTYIIRYSAVDPSGNSAQEVTRTVNVVDSSDTTAPIITAVTPQEAGVYYVSDLTLEVTTDEAASVYYSLDGGANTQMNDLGSNTYTYDATIADGTHTITFSATDLAGNTGYLTVNFDVDTSSGPDTTAPVITVIRPLEGEDYDEDITFEVELNEMATVTYSLDGAAAITMTEESTLTFISEDLTLDDGFYTVVFTATDLAGNTASVTVNFEIDDSTSDNKDDKDNKWGSDSYFDAKFIDQYQPKKTVIDLTDDSVKAKLNWFQRLINWIVGLFGGKPVYY